MHMLMHYTECVTRVGLSRHMNAQFFEQGHTVIKKWYRASSRKRGRLGEDKYITEMVRVGVQRRNAIMVRGGMLRGLLLGGTCLPDSYYSFLPAVFPCCRSGRSS